MHGLQDGGAGQHEIGAVRPDAGLGGASRSILQQQPVGGGLAVAAGQPQPVDPLPPATLIEGDFTADGVEAELVAALGGPPNLLLSDMAPNTIGHPQTDHCLLYTSPSPRD